MEAKRISNKKRQNLSLSVTLEKDNMYMAELSLQEVYDWLRKSIIRVEASTKDNPLPLDWEPGKSEIKPVIHISISGKFSKCEQSPTEFTLHFYGLEKKFVEVGGFYVEKIINLVRYKKK